MNFKHMPELDNPYGYYVVIGFMAVLTIGMAWYFKYKKWF
jgi:magnesium transporter